MTGVLSKNVLCYEGKVDLYIEKNGKELHLATLNEGLSGVSELFTRAALGYKTDEYRPWYVDVRTTQGYTILYDLVEVRASSFDIVSGETGEDAYMNGWRYPVFDALITTENIVEIGNGVCYIYLLSKNYTELARVAINIDDGTLEDNPSDIPTLGLREGNNILIRWAMYLSNRTKGDN